MREVKLFIFILMLMLVGYSPVQATQCCYWDYPNGWHEHYDFIQGAYCCPVNGNDADMYHFYYGYFTFVYSGSWCTTESTCDGAVYTTSASINSANYKMINCNPGYGPSDCPYPSWRWMPTGSWYNCQGLP